MHAALARLPIDMAFDLLGEAGAYTPAGGGAAVPCRVIAATPDAAVEFGGAALIRDTARLEVRATEVTPEPGGVFALTDSARSFRVVGQPRRADAQELVWTCEAERV